MAIVFGYENIHLFGMDSCVNEEDHHAYEYVNQEEEVLCSKGMMEVSIGSENGKVFKMAGYHIAQMIGFKEILTEHSGKAMFTVHGGGVLAELMRLGREEAQRQERCLKRRPGDGQENGSYGAGRPGLSGSAPCE
jgi:hypothetical protein